MSIDQAETTAQTAPVPLVLQVRQPRDESASAEKAKEIEHSSGGVPVVPAVTVTTGAAVTTVAAAGVAAGPGALAAAAVATGAGLAAVGVSAARRAVRERRAASSGRGDSGRGTATSNRSAGTSTSAGRRGGLGASAGAGRRGGASSLLSAARNRAAGVGAVRRGAGATGPSTRGGQRRQLTNARRAQADARRQDRAGRDDQRRADRDQKRSARGGSGPSSAGGPSLNKPNRGTGPNSAKSTPRSAGRLRGAAGRTLAAVQRRLGAAGRGLGNLPGRARDAWRKRSDARRDGEVARERRGIHHRAANRAARRALWRSAVRHNGRRALAALVASPVGLLSLLMWPLAKLFKLRRPKWFIRLFRRLMRGANEARAKRDGAIRAERDRAHEAIDTPDTTDERGGIRRARAGSDTAPAGGSPEGTAPMGHLLRDLAEEFLSTVKGAEAPGAMHMLHEYEGNPDAIKFLADAIGARVSMCADEMPLDPAVADALNEVYDHLVKASEAAEEAARVFRIKHAADISRHEDPRTAEKKWDITENED